MINDFRDFFFINHKFIFSCIFGWIAMLSNSYMDAIDFSKQRYKPNAMNVWHWIKWPVCFVCLILFGVCSHDYIIKVEWAKTWEVWGWFSINTVATLCWYPHYQFHKKRFNKKFNK